ncbi:hypothetical protein AA13595_1925 [Gluconacetobacter johannae DSM 13595]|uniref:Glycosyltransferase RgtA/B/C/D-like domain-containing protein n=1 Tax=Gluconacetobacter johannae TaxID=112140 RepID=A0A7W4P474_9PROT|nr:hypothetical protein [Gluconacetobacter johannae]MBB2174748.1 hypothetical protein [Gluconacetobacter johannae]GBQ86575.1 hypothetical protein AA13595_1925 [Gluconacetobacter johannae DSM 13595]
MMVDRLIRAGAGLLILVLLLPVLMIPYRISLNYNEGWNAYLALRAVGAALPLYPPAGGMVFNNYPPLGFSIVGLIGAHLTGDMIVAGRIVALLALLASGALVACCVRRLGGAGRPAVAAGLLLLLNAATIFPAYVAMDDPQWLAHALMLGGLAMLLGDARHPRHGVARVALAALLVVAGGFVKHNLVALPLAVTVWLACCDRRALLVWCGAGLLAGLAGLGVTDWAYGPAVFADILGHRRVMDPAHLLVGIRKLSEILGLLVVGLLAATPWGGRPPADARDRRPGLFALLFLGLALVTGLTQRMGDGVNYNAHFETLIAACIAVGLALSRPPRTVGPLRLTPTRLLCIAALPLVVAVPVRLIHAWSDLRRLPDATARWQAAIAHVGHIPGPAACETLALCYWAGKTETIDFFNLTQAMRAGRQAFPLDDMARRRVLGVIEYDPRAPRHRDAMAADGHDPIVDPFRAAGYDPAFTGPDRIVFLTPKA